MEQPVPKHAVEGRSDFEKMWTRSLELSMIAAPTLEGH